MRSVLALSLLITLCAPAGAAMVHHSRSRSRHHVIVRPGQDVAIPRGGTSFPARQRNAAGARIKWIFTTEKARAKNRPRLFRHIQRVTITVPSY
jgi:hypothetical protein